MKRAINKEQFNRLITFTKNNKTLRKETRVKLTTAYTLLYHTGCRIDEIRCFSAHELKSIVQQKEITLKKNNTNFH